MNPFHASTVGRIRRQITSILVAMSLSVGMVVANPTAGQAASMVQARFWLNGYAPDTPGVIEGLNANFFIWVEGQGWHYFGSMTLSRFGWTGITVPPQAQRSYFGIQVSDRKGAAAYSSGMVVFPPGGQRSIQYQRVNCYGC